MEKDYIYDLLIQFTYHELSADMALDVAHLIDEHPDVKAQYEEIRTTKVHLPKVQFNPSSNVLHNILQYSTKTALEAQV
ncbi:MAG: hypothetical protein R2792_09655 [Saprospiraceae bacterium]|jgi:hypothetical protein